jgi:hypothetical protein
MKTAIVISGEPRTFTDCYPSLDACILSKNKCDIFLHLYEDENTSDVLKVLSPKIWLIEKKKEVAFDVPSICETNKPPEVSAFSTMCQWRNIQKAFGLIDDYYDCVLKTRYDIKYTNPLILEKYNMDCLNVPIGGDWRGGLFDMLAFGSLRLMKNYCCLFDRIQQYCESGVPCHSETLNRFNNRNALIHRFDYTVLLRRQFDRGYIEDRVFTLR